MELAFGSVPDENALSYVGLGLGDFISGCCPDVPTV